MSQLDDHSRVDSAVCESEPSGVLSAVGIIVDHTSLLSLHCHSAVTHVAPLCHDAPFCHAVPPCHAAPPCHAVPPCHAAPLCHAQLVDD